MTCPECESVEVSMPSHSDPYYACADCGHSWSIAGFEALVPTGLRFFVGLDRPSDAKHFERCMVSINALHRRRPDGTLKHRKSDFACREWMLDSGAFTQIKDHGRFVMSCCDYAQAIVRWSRCSQMVAAVSQDYMCEAPALAKTGLTVKDHQRLTIERYIEILGFVNDATYLMPVLQGYEPWEYVSHLRQYGWRLREGAWVGVGSVCKRNARIDEIERVLVAIRDERPDLRLHGFGVKITALQSDIVRSCLWSCDSMAWSAAARRQGENQHDWRRAQAFVDRIEFQPVKTRECQRELPWET